MELVSAKVLSIASNNGMIVGGIDGVGCEVMSVVAPGDELVNRLSKEISAT